MKFFPFGNSALLINFEQKISVEVNARVVVLNETVRKLNGVSSTIPAYCSLTIIFDPQITSFDILKKEIEQIDVSKSSVFKPRKIIIPVCYADKYALDLPDLEDQLQIGRNKIIELHHKKEYLVFMMGFLPGFGYMGKLPNKLHCKRKAQPRKHLPGQSVGIAGMQTGIYPIDAPGGWQIIGKTPVSLFLSGNDFLLRAGDMIKFNPITEDRFNELQARVEGGKFNTKELYE